MVVYFVEIQVVIKGVGALIIKIVLIFLNDIVEVAHLPMEARSLPMNAASSSDHRGPPLVELLVDLHLLELLLLPLREVARAVVHQIVLCQVSTLLGC